MDSNMYNSLFGTLNPSSQQNHHFEQELHLEAERNLLQQNVLMSNQINNPCNIYQNNYITINQNNNNNGHGGPNSHQTQSNAHSYHSAQGNSSYHNKFVGHHQQYNNHNNQASLTNNNNNNSSYFNQNQICSSNASTNFHKQSSPNNGSSSLSQSANNKKMNQISPLSSEHNKSLANSSGIQDNSMNLLRQVSPKIVVKQENLSTENENLNGNINNKNASSTKNVSNTSSIDAGVESGQNSSESNCNLSSSSHGSPPSSNLSTEPTSENSSTNVDKQIKILPEEKKKVEENGHNQNSVTRAQTSSISRSQMTPMSYFSQNHFPVQHMNFGSMVQQQQNLYHMHHAQTLHQQHSQIHQQQQQHSQQQQQHQTHNLPNQPHQVVTPAHAHQIQTAIATAYEKPGSKKTAYNEKWGVKVLKAWLIEQDYNADFETLNCIELDDLLTKFWNNVRKSNGDYYGRNSLFNLRAMINKHLKAKPYNVNYDIVTDERFRKSNDCLEKQLKILKGIGKTICHKQPITIEDLRRMYDSQILSRKSPIALLRKVWFEITLHFCHKGSESQEKLLKSTFEIFRDLSGRSYISRNHKRAEYQNLEEIRMYETGGELCPVKSFQLYLMKLHPLQARLFQQPRRKATLDSPMWYGKAPIGEKALQQMMANISTAAKLSKRYTNHCVRTTALERFTENRKNKSIVMKSSFGPENTSSSKNSNSQQMLQNVISDSQNQKNLSGQNQVKLESNIIIQGVSQTAITTTESSSKSTSTNNSRLPSHESNEIVTPNNHDSQLAQLISQPQRLTNDFQIMSSNSSNGGGLIKSSSIDNKNNNNNPQVSSNNNLDPHHFGLIQNNHHHHHPHGQIHHQMSQMSQIGQMGGHHQDHFHFVGDGFSGHGLGGQDEHDVMGNNFQAL